MQCENDRNSKEILCNEINHANNTIVERRNNVLHLKKRFTRGGRQERSTYHIVRLSYYE